ncbi:MAG: citramalate synthase [Alphaproteobacteria bacterium]|jgi:2-isopropylmalate synthase|nr:citramalate synthase [Alphaproteobacteria bacterium]MDP6517471.1 citramalate synthase [Alphaproteobacteria bacterium]
MAERVFVYDTTLRDGGQTQGVDFGIADKIALAGELDGLGVDYIEAGWPGANPTDDAVFAQLPALARARIVAFGMTHRSGRSAENDPGLAGVLNAGTEAVCLVAKAWDFQVETALGIGLDENLAMIGDSTAFAVRRCDEVLLDAEHFFDGYKAAPDYALACLDAGLEAGAHWLVLCDTNGGALPHEIEAIVSAVAAKLPGDKLAIHCHNDSGTAVAGSLAAVRGGARQVQGTINGLGERCGNANLISVIPNLMLKMGFETGLGRDGLARLTHLSRLLEERINRSHNPSAPFVGASAFAHKGGLHVSAVAKDPRTYEHVAPDSVGNRRVIVVSDQAGKANLLARLDELGISIDPKSPQIGRLVELVKARESQGYAYDGADASFELLARRTLGTVPDYFTLTSFRVLDERRHDADGVPITLSEATMKLVVGPERIMTVAEGNGPVDALAHGLRKALSGAYADLADMRLVDYKVRILTPEDGTGATIRVMVESADGTGARWATVGVSDNVIAASYDALHDAITYKLLRAEAGA